nr:alpha/beta hydrolase [Gemmatimonadales bacterium]
GLIVVVPDYRLYPTVQFPAWVEDAAAAVRWVRDSIGLYGGDPARIFVVGHSAGAHTAALLALDQQHLRRVGVPRAAVGGFVALAGPVATSWTDADVQTLMGPRERWPATYPMTHVDRTDSPLLLLHGERDRTVSPANSIRLAERIRRRGGCARAITYGGIGHVGIVVALSLPRLEIAPVMEDIMMFVRRPRGTTGC